jgi:hypothetical protein
VTPPRARPAAAYQLSLFAEEPAAPAISSPPPPPAAAPDPARDDLRDRLDRLLDGRLRSLVLTANRSRILTVRPAGGADPAGFHLRLDACFAGAPEEVLSAVADWSRAMAGPGGGRGRGAADRRRALAALRAYFERHRRSATPAPRRPPRPIAPRGRWFDLEEIRDELNRRHFDGRLAASITWGQGSAAGGARWGCRRRRRSLQLGSYTYEDDLVRIHPALDRAGVPRYVVAAVVFHELLHAAMPPRVVDGRRRLHPPEFRRREREFPDHARAERWIAGHLGWLLRG